jgi:hypothetical protein
VALLLGQVRVADEAALGGQTRDLGPALPGGAVVGRRVDEKRGVANCS